MVHLQCLQASAKWYRGVQSLLSSKHKGTLQIQNGQHHCTSYASPEMYRLFPPLLKLWISSSQNCSTDSPTPWFSDTNNHGTVWRDFFPPKRIYYQQKKMTDYIYLLNLNTNILAQNSKPRLTHRVSAASSLWRQKQLCLSFFDIKTKLSNNYFEQTLVFASHSWTTHITSGLNQGSRQHTSYTLDPAIGSNVK